MHREPIPELTQVAVSAHTAETALNTEQATDVMLLLPKSFMIEAKPVRKTNKDMANGREEQSLVYHEGFSLEYSLPFDMCDADTLGFLLSYHLGTDTPAASGTGFNHAITRLAARAVKGFTAVQRLSNAIEKERFASNFVNTLNLTFAKGAYLKADAGIKATGKVTSNLTTEEVTAAYNATTLTLAANAVAGSTAADRLVYIHQVRCLVPATGEWVEVVCSAVSADTPAALTIVAPGGAATSTTYEVLYAPTEPAWCTLPARTDKAPMFVANLDVIVGGKYNGTTNLGGRTIGTDLMSIEWTSNRNMILEKRPVTGASAEYANFAKAGKPEQTLKLSKELRDAVLKQRMKDNETFAVRVLLIGPEYAAGENFEAELIWPQVSCMESSRKVGGDVITEDGNFAVQEGAIYSSVIIRVKNQIAQYAA